jgi:hypothetical protein
MSSWNVVVAQQKWKAPAPSKVPSDVPSFSPSWIPTVTPSVSPTIQPTPVCHDVSSYTSPLDFTCVDHAKTDCFQWSYLGLNATQIEELITNCPISCKIACGSLLHFEMELQYQIRNVDNFLSPTSKETLEEVSLDFTNEFVTNMYPEIDPFLLYQVELLSQTIIDDNLNNKQRSAVNLFVNVAFRGFAVDTSQDQMEQILTQGIYSPDYISKLQLSGDVAFQYADISNITAIPTDGIPSLRDEDGETTDVANNPSPAAIIVSVVATMLVVIGGAAALFLYRHRTSIRGRNNDKDEYELSLHSPAASSTRSPFATAVSFASAVGLISSPRPSGSAGSTTSLDQTSRGSDSAASATEKHELHGSFSFSSDEHPLANVIPPMLVYENIDDFDTEQRGPAPKRRKSTRVVPSRHIAATPDFLKSLRSRRVAWDETMYHGILDTSCEGELDKMEDENHEYTTEGIPIMTTTDADTIPCLRKSVSESAAEPKPQGLSAKWNRQINKNKKCHTRHASFSSRHSSGSINDESFENSLLFDDRTVRTGRRATGTVSFDARTSSNSGALDPSLSPYKLHKPSSSDRRKKQSSPANRSLSPAKAILKSRPSIPKPQCQTLFEGGTRFVFQVPRQGKLGLVVHSDSRSPIVTQVKDYSPLLGQVQRGDRVVEIDGVSTIGMSCLEQVNRILRGKTSGVFWLTVWRGASTPSEMDAFLVTLEGGPSTLLLSSSSSGWESPSSSSSKRRHRRRHSSTPPRSRRNAGGMSLSTTTSSLSASRKMDSVRSADRPPRHHHLYE